MSRDPFTIAAEGLESYIKESPGVKAAMKLAVKNIDGYTSTRSKREPDVHAESDLPAIRLIPRGGPSNINFASNLTQFDLSFEAVVVTGDQRFTKDLFPVFFAVFAACTAAIDDEAMMGLVWEEYRFVKNLSLSNANLGFSAAEGARSISGTIAVCTVTLHIYIPRTLVIAYHAQT